ncbi:MAG: OmpA family protein [Spirochaetales bacterium]|nr:OmpA family protein [Spirochaetales bacterium]
MKSIHISIILSAFILMSAFCEEEIALHGSIRGCPIVFDPVYSIMGIDVGTSWRLGYYNNSFSIGLTGSFDYTLIDNMRSDNPVSGNLLHTRVILDQSYSVASSAVFSGGFGGIWLKDTIAIGSTETQVTDYYGLSFDFNMKFTLPGKFLSLELLNRIDLLYSLSPEFVLTAMAPHYYGAVRFYLDFGIEWFQMYLEGKGQYWNDTYSGDNITSGFFSAGVGLVFNVPALKINKNGDSGVDVVVIEQEPPEEKEKIDPEVEKLKTIGDGDKVSFHNILFVKNSDELIEISFIILDQIAVVLKELTNMNFIISAYAEYQENPVEEFKLYTDRAKKIKTYLIQKGIAEERLKVSSSGQIVTENNQKRGSTVIFRAAIGEELGK